MSYRSTPGGTYRPPAPTVTPAPAPPATGWHARPADGGYTTSVPRSRPATPAAAAPGAGTDAQNDAYATLKGLLDQYGLGSLAAWAWQQLLQNHSPNQIMLDLYQQPEFQARFPAIAERQRQGLPPISPGEYIAYESAAGQIMRAAGFPPGFYDHPDDYTAFIAGNVSIAEISQRASIYQQAAYQTPLEVRQQLRELYGVTEGHIAAYFADPTRALPLIQQQFTAAQISGEASIQHFGGLSRTEAERLAGLGVTDQQAAEGFGQVFQARELFQQLPGEGDVAPGRSQALGLVARDAASVEAVNRQSSKRKAQFAGGGGFAATQQGLTGLGSANTN